MARLLKKIQTSPDIRKDMPSPSDDEMRTELFNQIFEVVKDWDINVPEYYSGYTSGNGSHVKLLLDVIKPALREDKLSQLGL